MTTRVEFEALKKMPMFKGKIVSNSMEPVIMVGEDIVVAVGEQDIKRFDIIVIFFEEKLICHYLWQKNRSLKPILLQTRNMFGQRDIPIREEDYFGKVLSHKLSLWQKLKILF